MIIIDNTLISDEVYSETFICDIDKCKGACCVEGDMGAPVEKSEITQLENYYNIFKQFMKPEGIEAVETQGKYIKGESGDLTTPLIKNKECAYIFFDDNNIAKCAIEKAFDKGLIDF